MLFQKRCVLRAISQWKGSCYLKKGVTVMAVEENIALVRSQLQMYRSIGEINEGLLR